MKGLQTLLATVQETLKNSISENHLQTKEPQCRPRFPVENFQDNTEAKIYGFGHIRESKRKNLPTSLLPQGVQFRARRDLSP